MNTMFSHRHTIVLYVSLEPDTHSQVSATTTYTRPVLAHMIRYDRALFRAAGRVLVVGLAGCIRPLTTRCSKEEEGVEQAASAGMRHREQGGIQLCLRMTAWVDRVEEGWVL